MGRQLVLTSLSRACWFTIIFSAFLRFILLNSPELLPEEAYYWNYSIHLAPGYLDHPPFTAWLIWLGTYTFGLNEFGVRVGAWICGLITLYFLYRTTLLLYGEKIALVSCSIVSLLPYFLGNSFYISPDAPLTSAWVACIYFLIQASREDIDSPRQWKWWSLFGICFGLGMLSKYSISLLALGTGLLFITDKNLRKWFLKPQPYLAVILAGILFSPVIYWNATNEWASFAFQSTRRFAEPIRFGLPSFLGQLLLLATPIGAYLISLFIFATKSKTKNSVDLKILKYANCFALLIFLISSLKSVPRLNWAGPSLLAFAPIFGLHFDSLLNSYTKSAKNWRRAWIACLLVSLLGFVGFWTYGGLGLPGIGYSANSKKLIGWQGLGEQILQVSQQLEQPALCQPLIIGMDKHYTAAELAFYVKKIADKTNLDKDKIPEVAGRAVVGLESLMFRYWLPLKDYSGCNAILVTRNLKDLDLPELKDAFNSFGEIIRFRSLRNGKPAGEYFYRIAREYKGKKLIEQIHDIPA